METSNIQDDDVETFLLDNPDFLENWLKKHGTPELMDKIKNLEVSKQTPKYNTSARNSITSSMFKSYVDGMVRHRRRSLVNKQKLLSMSESEMFMELIRDIASELDVNVLCHKILRNVSVLTGSDRGSLFLVRGSKTNRYLVSKLFDVTETSTLEESLHTELTEIKVPFGRGIAGTVAQTKETINIKDAYEDPRFNKEVDKKTGFRTHSILCMPILNYEGEVIGVAQIINKVTGNHQFEEQDVEVFARYLMFCGIGVTNAQLFEMSVQEYKRNRLLLNLARGVFEEQQNLENLVQKIMLDAQELLQCERCSVYLIDDSLDGDRSKFTGEFVRILKKFNHKSLLASLWDDNYSNQHPELSYLSVQYYVNKMEKKQPATSTSSFESSKPKCLKDILFSKAFDFYAKDGGNIHIQSASELANSKNSEIARYVVLNPTPLCVADVELDGRLGKGPIGGQCSSLTVRMRRLIWSYTVRKCLALLSKGRVKWLAKKFTDEEGFTTRSILCMPVYNSEKKLTGVTMLINKLDGSPFNDSDANIIEAFSIFTGLGIHNCQMYENACRLMAKQTVALEVLSFHATAGNEETEKLMSNIPDDGEKLKLYAYEFNDLVLTDDQTLQSTICMFKEAGLIQKFKIPLDVICRWTCSVKKNYRPVTYHNWRHAFNVTQTMFTMLFTGQLQPIFSELDMLAMLVACLCHDLDHRGTNNAFQVKVVSPLAMLYSTSVMEHHHFDHSIMILNSEGNNIFQSLSPVEYRQVIKMLEHCILSTDLALYFRKRGDFKKMIDSGRTEFANPTEKDLLKAMMMTACDVAAITKPWEIQREVAQLVANEFFEQGDVEKTQLGETPIAMMDRDKKDELPKMQVGFIDAICLPVYEMFAAVNSNLSPLHTGAKDNRQHWKELDDLYQGGNLEELRHEMSHGEPLTKQTESTDNITTPDNNNIVKETSQPQLDHKKKTKDKPSKSKKGDRTKICSIH